MSTSNQPAPPRFTRDQLVRYVGARPASRIPATILLSVLFTIVFFVVEQSMNSPFYAVLTGILTGTVVGLFPVSLVMTLLVLRVRAKHAMLWCFASTAFAAVLGLGLFGYEFIAVSGGVGFMLAVVLVFFFGPRYQVYRYGHCPGCKYNLMLLPKSDVCPECGRDNRDLVAMFSDLKIEKTPGAGRG